MHRVAVVAMPPVTPFDLTIPGLILGNATRDGKRLYEVRVCAVQPGPVATTDDLGIVVHWGLGILRDADTIVVTGTGSRDSVAPALVRALRRAHASSKRIASICTGAFTLAEAGLLDGRKATTYWLYSEELRRRFSAVDVHPDVLFLEDGNVVTSAGVAAGIDLCLHLVAQDFGVSVASDVARLAVVPPIRAGKQAQVIERPVVERSSSLAATREWAMSRLNKAISLAELAGHAHVTERTFTRRFREETGMSPLQWLLQQRIELARVLLERTKQPMDMVAANSGFGDADSLRQHFSRRIGISPGTYRAAFRRNKA